MKKLELLTKKRVKLEIKSDSESSNNSKIGKIEQPLPPIKSPSISIKPILKSNIENNIVDKRDQKQLFVEKYIPNYGDGTFYNGAWKEMLKNHKFDTKNRLIYPIHRLVSGSSLPSIIPLLVVAVHKISKTEITFKDPTGFIEVSVPESFIKKRKLDVGDVLILADVKSSHAHLTFQVPITKPSPEKTILQVRSNNIKHFFQGSSIIENRKEPTTLVTDSYGFSLNSKYHPYYDFSYTGEDLLGMLKYDGNKKTVSKKNTQQKIVEEHKGKIKEKSQEKSQEHSKVISEPSLKQEEKNKPKESSQEISEKDSSNKRKKTLERLAKKRAETKLLTPSPKKKRTESDTSQQSGMAGSQDNNTYFVEKILGRKEEDGKWEEYDDSYNTWEPEDNLDDCLESIRAFNGDIMGEDSQSDTSDPEPEPLNWVGKRAKVYMRGYKRWYYGQISKYQKDRKGFGMYCMKCEGTKDDVWWVHPNQLVEAPQIQDPIAEEEEHFSQEVIQNEMYTNFLERIEEEYAFCLSQAATIGEMQRELELTESQTQYISKPATATFAVDEYAEDEEIFDFAMPPETAESSSDSEEPCSPHQFNFSIEQEEEEDQVEKNNINGDLKEITTQEMFVSQKLKEHNFSLVNIEYKDEATQMRASDGLEHIQETKTLNVLSLFDGIAGAGVALVKLGVTPTSYYTCEIDADASKVSFEYCSLYNIPHVALGDIEKVNWKDIFSRVQFDLVIGGSPCQDLSVVNYNRKGLKGRHSRLFYNYAQVLDLAKSQNPNVLFLLENVKSMRDEDRDEITRVMGVNPVQIDALQVSATKRNRYYWTNIPRTAPIQTKDLKAQDFLSQGRTMLEGYEKFACFTTNNTKNSFSLHTLRKFKNDLAKRNKFLRKYNAVFENGVPVPLKPREIERLLGFDNNHTLLGGHLSDMKRKFLLGNSFSIPVVSYLLSPLAMDEQKEAKVVMLQRRIEMYFTKKL